MKLIKPLLQGAFALGLAVGGLAISPSADASTLNPPYTSVQLFKWRWNDIATECTQWLGPQGYGGVQISPPSASLANSNWWDMYQPVNYVSLTSDMGNATQLQTMINTCHAAGVRIYADIVVNQMAGSSGTATDGTSTWNANSDTALQYPYFSTSDFHSYCAIASSDYNNNTYNVQHCWLVGLPDLATESTYVQGQIETYMETLIGMGVDGFRMDAAKHQQEDQLAIIFNAVKAKYPTTLQGESLFVTQEIIPDGEVNRPSYEALGTLNEFQFVYAMQDIFRNTNGLTPASIPTVMGTPGNWGGSWGFLPSASAQIFVDDWDTERNSGGSLNASDYVSGEENDAVGTYRYDLANIFMLATPYGAMAQVQSGFRFTDDNQNMPSTSAFSNGVAQVPTSRSTSSGWDFIHRWPDISNMVKFRTATNGQGLSNWVTGTNNQIAFSRGAIGFVALNNDSTSWSNTFQTGLPAGTYCNVVNGVLSGSTCTADTVTVNASGYATVTIPANGGSVVPAVAIYTGQVQAAATVPVAPTGVAAAVSGTTINLSWTASSGATSYTVYRSTSSSSGFASVGTVTTTSFANTGLTASTTYYYYVTATNSAGTSTDSSTISATTGSSSTYTSNWSTMYLRGSMNSWGSTAMTLVANHTWQVTVSLTASTAYTYKFDASGAWTTNENWGVGSTSGVAVVNAGNISYTTGTATSYVFSFNDSTLAYSVSTPVVIPSAPTSVAAAVASASQINLTWTAATGATAYQVYRSTSSSSGFVEVGTSTTASYADSGLSASTTYYYYVTASDSAGTSTDSSTVSATTSAAGTYTSNFTSMYLRGTMNSWGATAMALVANHTWQVTVALTASTAYTYKFDAYDNWASTSNWGVGSVSGTAAVNTGNISYTTGTGTNYTFTFNDSTLAYSVVDPVSTAAPTVPTNVRVSATTSTTVSLAWAASTAASSYTVYRSTSSTGTFTSIGTTASTLLTDTGLSSSTTYYYYVTATNTHGTSAKSAVVSTKG